MTVANVQTCLSTGEHTESEMQNADSLIRNIQPVVYNTIIIIIIIIIIVLSEPFMKQSQQR